MVHTTHSLGLAMAWHTHTRSISSNTAELAYHPSRRGAASLDILVTPGGHLASNHTGFERRRRKGWWVHKSRAYIANEHVLRKWFVEKSELA